jgi:3-methyl-2-oxobutanoate hydroxymethyltransferase
MSVHTAQAKKKVTVASLMAKKAQGEKIVMVTCYDSAFGKIVDRSSVDIVLVGDSLGNVMLGHQNTIPVTLDDMIHHSRAVARTMSHSLLIADMPFFSYHVSTEQALANAGRLMQEGMCEGVKVEGAGHVVEVVHSLSERGIPVVAHLGLTPQSINLLSGYRVQGREQKAAEKMLADAKSLQDAGAIALVLELVPDSLAKRLSTELKIPTIGIGAGVETDGQVLVLHDLLGFDTNFKPKFLKHYANLGDEIFSALETYASEVRGKIFPAKENSYTE